MLYKAHPWDEIFELINRNLKLIKQWMFQNNVFLNFEKIRIVFHALTENTIPSKKCIKIHNIHVITNGLF